MPAPLYSNCPVPFFAGHFLDACGLIHVPGGMQVSTARC